MHAQGFAGLLNYKISGKGTVRKNPMGKFIWDILHVIDPMQTWRPRQRHYYKQQILRILFNRVKKGEPITVDIQRSIIHDFMDLWGIQDNDTLSLEIKERLKSILRQFLIGVENGSLEKNN